MAKKTFIRFSVFPEQRQFKSRQSALKYVKTLWPDNLVHHQGSKVIIPLAGDLAVIAQPYSEEQIFQAPKPKKEKKPITITKEQSDENRIEADQLVSNDVGKHQPGQEQR